MHKVALIGVGNMGEALLAGWLDSGMLDSVDIVITDKSIERRRMIAERYGVEEGVNNTDAASGAKTVLLAVKPQDSGAVLDELKELGPGKVLVSIVAGLPIDSIRKKVGGEPSIIRVMPNVAAMVRSAISAYTVEPGTGGFTGESALALLAVAGEIVEVKEDLMSLVTALSGSGPAYFFLMVEALTEAGVDGGMSGEVAEKFARETLWGAAKIIRETGRDAGEMREAVSSPGGTTLAAIEVFERAGFRGLVKEAVEAARSRAEELQR